MTLLRDLPGQLLSISVMAHPSRAEHFPYLAEKLGIGMDKFSIDTGFGLWENCRRAWELRDPTALYHVVIQDDAIVCENFRDRAEEAIYAALRRESNIAFSFYYGRRANIAKEQAAALERGYAIRRSLTWGVAVCLPGPLIPDMLRECNGMYFTPQDDARIGHFLKMRDVRVYHPLPCLIDHRSGPSLVGDPGENRHAYAFIDS